VGLEPVDFSNPYRTITQPHGGNTLPFPPPAAAIALLKHREETNTATNRNRFRVGYASDNFKVHGRAPGFLTTEFTGPGEQHSSNDFSRV